MPSFSLRGVPPTQAAGALRRTDFSIRVAGCSFIHPNSIWVDFPDKDLLAILTKPTTDPRGLRGKIVDLYKDGRFA